MTTPRIRLSAAEYEAVLRARAAGGTLVAPTQKSAEAGSVVTDEVRKGGDERVIELVSDVRTIEDALAYAKVDLAIWEVERSVVNKWDMGYTDADKQAHAKGLWQVKVWLKRRARKGLTDALEELHRRAEQYAPEYELPRLTVRGDHLYVVSLYDQHFGKLAWEQETGNNYDIEIAERLFSRAVEDLLGYAQGLPVERILFPVGHDFLHVDNIMLTTQKGTQLGADTEGRYAKIVQTGFMALVRAIDRMAAIAPVDVVLVQGNHDPTVSYHLCRELAAWFRHCDRVRVDYKFRARKYYEFGSTLLGLTHGDECPDARLINLMPMEMPQAWARTRTREWHKGHWHKRRQVQTTPVDTFEGVTVRTLPSLSGKDAWHYRKGFLGSRAAEAYVYHRERGYVGHFATDAREVA